MYSSTILSALALDGSGWSMSRPGFFSSRNPLCRRLGGPQGRSGRVRKISPPTGIRSPDHTVRSKSLYRLRLPGNVGNITLCRGHKLPALKGIKRMFQGLCEKCRRWVLRYRVALAVCSFISNAGRNKLVTVYVEDIPLCHRIERQQ
jgi:hypothetical protein